MFYKSHSFTLIEMMIVVAIIIFLSSIAVPRLFKYSAKAKQAEAAMMLASLHTAQQLYRAEHGYYSKKLGGKNGLWQPEGYNNKSKKANFYYTYGFYFPGAQEGIHYYIGKLQTPPEKLGSCTASQDTFVARAAGYIVDTTKADLWSIDETRAITHEQQGV